MDEELPYADDIPYEEQLPSPAEPVGGVSLKERIGNRIYLLEDSMSRKRKLVDVEEAGQTEGDHPEDTVEEFTDADPSHRPNALLLQGPPITQLPTARVFAYATHFDAHPIGLEWVDDQTCVLVFTSRSSAVQAWDALRRVPSGDSSTVESEGVFDDAFYPALPLPLALYPIEERINSVLGNSKTVALKEAMHIRWARSGDAKVRGARVQSEFYKRHGHTAGKEGLPGLLRATGQDHSTNGNKRRKHNEDDSETKRKLDAELDTLWSGETQHASNSMGSRVTGRHALDAEEKRRLLDEELDSFLAHEDDSERELAEHEGVDTGARTPSLFERTTRHDRPQRPLPRRGRRGRDDDQKSRADGDSRWLHNDEITQRKRTGAYDRNEFGMRAWAPADDEPLREPHGGRTRRPRRTQEELDQELEQFSRAE